MDILQFALGVGLLVGGAYLLVEGGSRMAVVMGVKPVVVGLTVVAFGTSAPEFFVSVMGVIKHSTDLVLGNVIGSNVANIGLILALAAIVQPVLVEKGLPRREIPLMVGVTLLFSAMALDGELSRVDGAILTVLFGAFMFFTIRSGNRGQLVGSVSSPEITVVAGHRARELTWGGGQVILGMAGLAGGGHFIVNSATRMAAEFGISEGVIGLTLVAVGTSLPELATTIVAALKKQDDLALGNIIGSNLFNILGVAGPVALFRLKSESGLLPELIAMCGLTLALALMIWISKRAIGRFQGAGLLSLYALTIFLWLK